MILLQLRVDRNKPIHKAILTDEKNPLSQLPTTKTGLESKTKNIQDHSILALCLASEQDIDCGVQNEQ